MLISLFGNQTLVFILRALASRDAVTAPALARESGFALNAVQKQLKKLEAGGWILPIFEGNHKLLVWNVKNKAVLHLKRLLRYESISGNVTDDAAYGLNLSLAERVNLCENLTREAEFLSTGN